MRRLVLTLLMCLLPLQWSWAVAASVCAHEAGGSHFGHHTHQHIGGDDIGSGTAHAPQPAEASPEESPSAADLSFGNHPDCQTCHAGGVLCMGRAVGPLPERPADNPPPSHRAWLPEPPVENLLRPPLTPLA